MGAITALAAVGVVAAIATNAQAFPSMTSACTGCHNGVNVPVTATLASTAGTTATYNVSAPGADSIAVFDGSAKVATIAGATGQFAVATGKTYRIYSVTGPGTADGLGQTTVSPAAPPVADVTAPVTTSNAQASYVSQATIALTATDSGSGVAATYYRLNGGAQVAGRSLTVSTVGAHTVQFWSVDVAGNTEAAKSASFTITAPPVADVTAPVTTSNAQASYVSQATIALTATDSGSGVAATYYRLNGGAQVAGRSLTVSTVGAHTVQFWSVDVAGNTEAAKSASFTITAPPVPPTPSTDVATSTVTIDTTRDRIHRGGRAMISGLLTPAIQGDAVRLYVMKPGSSEWTYLTTIVTSTVDGDDHARFDSDDDDARFGSDDDESALIGAAAWNYRFRAYARGLYQFQVRFAGDESRTTSVSETISVVVR